MYRYAQDVQDSGKGIPSNVSDDGTCATCGDVTGETGGLMLTPPQPGISQVPTGVPATVPSSAVSPDTGEGGPLGPPSPGPCDLRAPWWVWLAGGLVVGHYAGRRRA